MRLVSREEWMKLDKTPYGKKTTDLATYHYKTSYYCKQGNLVGFYESFPIATGEMVSIYFIV